MALLHPFLTTDEGIKTNVLRKGILFRFILPTVLKESYSLNKVTILKDINKERICRTERHLASLKKKILFVHHLTNNDIKKYKQNIETEICSNLPTTFWHRHQHIVQSSCEKDPNGKHTKDRTMLIISFSQYERTNSLTDVPNKIIINNIHPL